MATKTPQAGAAAYSKAAKVKEKYPAKTHVDQLDERFLAPIPVKGPQLYTVYGQPNSPAMFTAKRYVLHQGRTFEFETIDGEIVFINVATVRSLRMVPVSA